MIILKYISRQRFCGCGLDSSGLGCGLVADSCEHGNAALVSTKGGKILTTSDFWLFKNDYIPWS
jgi:hypothetical protein